MVKIPVTELRRPRLGYSAIDRSWLLEQPPLGRGRRSSGSLEVRQPGPPPHTLRMACRHCEIG